MRLKKLSSHTNTVLATYKPSVSQRTLTAVTPSGHDNHNPFLFGTHSLHNVATSSLVPPISFPRTSLLIRFVSPSSLFSSLSPARRYVSSHVHDISYLQFSFPGSKIKYKTLKNSVSVRVRPHRPFNSSSKNVRSTHRVHSGIPLHRRLCSSPRTTPWSHRTDRHRVRMSRTYTHRPRHGTHMGISVQTPSN